MGSNIQAQAQKFMEQHLGQLVGMTVTGLANDGAGNWGIMLENKSKQKLAAWISRDPEGNGPGWLQIEPQ